MPRAVLGVFDDLQSAQSAVADLQRAGARPEQLSVITRTGQPTAEVLPENVVPEMTTTGAVSGAILGGLTGWVLSLGPFYAWGLGDFATQHAAGATVLGALFGGALIGLLAGIAGLSLRGEDRRTAPNAGHILVTALTTALDSESAAELMKRNGAVNVQYTDDIPDPGYAPGSLPHSSPESSAPLDRVPAAGTPAVERGQRVVTLDDEPLGVVARLEGDYFVVAGSPTDSELFVPFEQLHEWRNEYIVVSATRDEVPLRGWQDRPLQTEHDSQGPTRP